MQQEKQETPILSPLRGFLFCATLSKPTNILVQFGDRGGLVFKITDFGIGSLAGAPGGSATGLNLPTVLQRAHTPLYASPQQIQGAPPDPRDDVFALGVIWYQMLSGDLTTG